MLARIVIPLVCAATLGWAGIAKALNPDAAAQFVGALTRAIPAIPAVYAIAAMEILAALWLLSGIRRRAALWTFAGVMLVFAALIAVAALRGYQGSCGCFGHGSAGAVHEILRNLALAAFATLGALSAVRARPPAVT